jgi:putative alpha-1,2-mannosidase
MPINILPIQKSLDEWKLHTGLRQRLVDTSGLPDTISAPPVSRFSHKNETASPAYYRLVLDSYKIVAELTGSVRSGMMRFTYPGNNSSCVFIRINSDEKQGRIWINKEQNEIALCNPVHRIYQGTGQPAGFSCWFVILDSPFEPMEKLANQQIAVNFGNQNCKCPDRYHLQV